MLVFVVLPELPSIQHGSLLFTTGFCLVPAVFQIFTRGRDKAAYAIYTFNALLQFSVLIVCPLLYSTHNDGVLWWSFPLSSFFISFGSSINYLHQDTCDSYLSTYILIIKKKIKRCQVKIYLLTSIYKISLTLLLMTAFVSMRLDVHRLWSFENVACSSSTSADATVVIFISIYACCSLFTYFASRSAIKIRMSISACFVPILLSHIIIQVILSIICNGGDASEVLLPLSLSWKCYDLNTLFSDDAAWIALLWWGSYIFTTFSLWKEYKRLTVLEQSEKYEIKTITNKICIIISESLILSVNVSVYPSIFMKPLYDGCSLDCSILHNRIPDNSEEKTAHIQVD